MHIVCLEDGSHRLAPLARCFGRAGHLVTALPMEDEALRHLHDAPLDALVADAACLDRRGIGAFSRSRLDVALLALQGPGAPPATALLESGVDALLAPEDEAELALATLVACVRRAKGHAASRIALGPLSIDLDQRSCTAAGRRIALSATEFALLEALALRAGQRVSRQALSELLYPPGEEPLPRTLDAFVHRLRAKLAQPGWPPLIEGSGHGFRLAAGEGAA